MANVQHFKRHQISNMLRHNDRTIQYSKNQDIDNERTKLNYSLLPERDLNSYDYFKSLIKGLEINNNKNLNIATSWIITAPKELDPKLEKTFFMLSYYFLTHRYGEDNCIQATVHKDEAGQPHLHFVFIPITKNENKEIIDSRRIKVLDYKKKHPELSGRQIAKDLKLNNSSVAKWLKAGYPEEQKKYKICACEVVDRNDLKTFHSDFQKFLNSQGLNVNVNSGITKLLGENVSIEQLKNYTKQELIKFIEENYSK